MSRPSDRHLQRNSTADDGVCTLREAIEVASDILVRDERGAGDADFDEIRFAAASNNEDIDLAWALLEHTIADDRVLLVDAGGEAELVGLTIRNGIAADSVGGSILNKGGTNTLRATILADGTLDNCFVAGAPSLPRGSTSPTTAARRSSTSRATAMTPTPGSGRWPPTAAPPAPTP